LQGIGKNICPRGGWLLWVIDFHCQGRLSRIPCWGWGQKRR
jgi:hypothetical protein